MSQFFQDDGEAANGRRKICLATTAYENPDAGYTFSIQKSREYLHRNGLLTAYFLLSGNCHVDDARNSIVQEFLLSDCTDLVFLDADVVWEPSELLKLCRYDVDIVGGIYPYRREGAESRKSLPLVMYPDIREPDAEGLIEVAGLPTGFMKIRRNVLEKLSETADLYWKKTDRRSQVPILFERTYFDGVRLGGDLSFCKKWIESGGKVYAAANIRLGHVVKTILHDSLGAFLRRESGSTLAHLVESVRHGAFDPHIFSEAREAIGNKWGAMEDVLTMCALVGAKADGPIIETGSGLTSIVLGASTSHPVFCLEHDRKWAQETRNMISAAGVGNVHIVECDIQDGWYSVPTGLPSCFSVGLNDGPPRSIGSRMGFFDHFSNTDTIICDDADDVGYGSSLLAWGDDNGYRVDFIERSAILRRHK